MGGINVGASTILQEDQNQLRKYLLGEATEAEEEKVELRLLSEAGYSEELDILVDELIDQYLTGELSGDERLNFERYFLSTPERHQKLRLALALRRYASSRVETADSESAKAQPSVSLAKLTWATRFKAFWLSPSWSLRAAVALGALAIIAGALWLSLPSAPRTVAALTLTISNSDRAEGFQASEVHLPPNADTLRISLILPEQSPPAVRYRVELENNNGEARPLEVIGQEARSVSVVITTAQLPRGQYALKLFTISANGTEQRVNGSYFFTVK